ncbi:MAG: hypothetical protein ACQES0_08370 [Bacteroidota bacterium]
MLKKLLCYISIVLVAMLVANRTFYLHTHIMPDGSAVQHAHPFPVQDEKQGNEQHKHSVFEFLFFDQILLLFIAAALLMAVINEFNGIIARGGRHLPSFFGLYRLPLLRAPPDRL